MSRKREIRTDEGFDIGFGAGINERDRFSISVAECTAGENFILDIVGRLLRRRPPQDLVATTPNGGTVTGIMQMIKRDDSQTQLVVDDNIVYDWDGATVFSDVTPPIFTSGTGGTRLRSSYWSLDDILVVTDLDLENLLYKWDGTTVSRLKSTLTVGSPQSATLTCSGSLATATVTTHGYATGDLVTIAGANETEYNGEHQITVTGANTFTYPMVCSTSPATGTITADKGVELKAKYSLVHDNRVWLFNVVADGEPFPQMILASAFEDAEDYDNATRGGFAGPTANDAFFVLSPDLKPVNGAAEFFSKLIISTVNGKLFVLDGNDATNYTFREFYPRSGARGNEGMINIGNDLVYFRQGKAFESLVATDEFGDVAADDLSRWIPNTIKELNAPIVTYDQANQRVYLFDADYEGVLVYDKEFANSPKALEAGLSPWSSWKTTMLNKWVTKAATEIRPDADSNTTVYWGDNAGNIYNMNGVGLLGDGGSAVINTNRKSRVITEMNTYDEVMIGRLEYQRLFSVDVDLEFAWLDELNNATVTLTLKPSTDFAEAAHWGGEFYWNDTAVPCYWGAGRNVSDAEQVSSLGFSVPGKSTGFILTVRIADNDEFVISRMYA